MMSDYRRHVQSTSSSLLASPRDMEAVRAVRFVDSTGRHWVVRELPGSPRATGEQQSPSLLFEAEGTIRRVRHYPANWSELQPAELETLSWRT